MSSFLSFVCFILGKWRSYNILISPSKLECQGYARGAIESFSSAPKFVWWLRNCLTYDKYVVSTFQIQIHTNTRTQCFQQFNFSWNSSFDNNGYIQIHLHYTRMTHTRIFGFRSLCGFHFDFGRREKIILISALVLRMETMEIDSVCGMVTMMTIRVNKMPENTI